MLQTVSDPYLALREATGQWQAAPASVTQRVEAAKAYVRRTCDPNAGRISAGNGSIAGSIYTWMNTTTSYWLEKTLHPENVGDMLYSGVNYLTYGFVDGMIQQYEQRAQEMQNDPSLYSITNWAFSGIPDRIKGTIDPEEPLSLQHWLDSLSVVMIGYSFYRGYQISQEPANTINTPHSATGTGMQEEGVCFVAGTAVLSADGKLPVEEVSVGDEVLCADPETGEYTYRTVSRTFVNQTEELTAVTISGEQIVSTPTHPYYVEGKGWVEACALHEGQTVWLANGTKTTVEAVSSQTLQEPVTVYNFEVEDLHTYFVGDCGVLVHNACNAGSATTNSQGPTYVEGGGHAGAKHAQAINAEMADMVQSGNYARIYGNRQLTTAGLNGTQRPDIIGIRWDGTVDLIEYASPSQASPAKVYALGQKLVDIVNANPGIPFHTFMHQWGTY